MSNPVRLQSIGVYLPNRRESNDELAERLGFQREFLEQKMGVLCRSVKEAGETTGDLAVRAFEDLRVRASLPVEQI